MAVFEKYSMYLPLLKIIPKVTKEIAKKIMVFTAEAHNVNSKSSISRYFSTFFDIQEIQGVSKSPVKWHSAMHGHLAQISPSSILKVTTKTM